MGDVGVRVENLGKRYRIGAANEAYGMLRDQLASAARAPLRRLRGQNGGPTEEFWALKDVSFEVGHGEVLGIIGRNGAGKSTLLKILSRITEPTTGRAEIHGRVGSLLEVGTGFHPELTGRENIYLNGAILGMTKRDIDSRFDEIVEFAGIGQFLDTPVKRYSSGMYMRLAFSIAAHLEPEVLIVDEVLAVGDAEFQKRSLGKMGDVAREGRTVLFVSHNMAAVQSLCDQTLVLNSGRIVCLLDVDSAVQRYLATARDRAGESERVQTAERYGSGVIRFGSVRFVDDLSGEPLEQIVVGSRVRCQLRYEITDPTCLGRRLTVGLGFQDDWERFLFAVNNEAVGFRLVASAGGLAEVLLPKFPLAPGQYHCYIYSEVHGTMADWVPHAVRIQVTAGDFYGTGKLPGGGQQGVFVPYEWIG